jgi:fatty acid desaturase
MSETPSRDPSRDAMSVAAISSERTESDENAWTRRLVLFLRVMAVISVIKGLYHWAQVTGFIGSEEDAFENQPMTWQTATVYFAVIELVAAVGLWLATPWGAVVWLTTVVSMGVIELMFPANFANSANRGLCPHKVFRVFAVTLRCS